jgi:hypothetical protein
MWQHALDLAGKHCHRWLRLDGAATGLQAGCEFRPLGTCGEPRTI